MRERQGLRCVVAAVLLLTAMTLRAECVAAEKLISQPGLFPNFVAGPIATNGSILALAMSDTGSAAPAIRFATYDSNLSQLGPERQIVDASVNGATALIWNGSEFVAFFQALSLALQFQRIDVGGNVIGPPITVANHAWSPDDEYSVVWVPARNAYAIGRTVTLGPDRGLWVTIVSPTGAILTDTQISLFIAPPTQPQVLALPDGRVGLLWTRKGETPILALTLVAASGPLQSVTVSEREVIAARAATDGNSILVIFASKTPSGGTELRYAQFDLSANRTRADSAFLAASGIDIVPSHLEWNAALFEWALTYIDAASGLLAFPGETRLRRFTSVGATPSDTLLSPNVIHSRLVAPFPLVFLNGAYIASIQRIISRTEGSESYLVKLCPFFVTANADHPVWRPFLPVTFTGSASGGSPGYTFDWEFGDNDSARGQTVQHIYQNPGTYTVTLTGIDAAGAVHITRTAVVIIGDGRRRAVRR